LFGGINGKASFRQGYDLHGANLLLACLYRKTICLSASSRNKMKSKMVKVKSEDPP
jgi:hypothetical protein